MHVGFVGTGNMGGPMATNLLEAGHRLTVFDARAEATAPLEKLGARRAPDLPTVAAAVEVTLTSLPNDAIVEEVLFGTAGTPGLIAGGRAGHVVFDLSTVSPDTTRRLAVRAAERGIRLIDAPVSGSVSGAVAGTLAVMIGAPADDVAPYESVLRAIGKNLFCLGETGRGNILKLLNNYVALTNQAALCEAMAPWALTGRLLERCSPAPRVRASSWSANSLPLSPMTIGPASSLTSRGRTCVWFLSWPSVRAPAPKSQGRHGSFTERRAEPASACLTAQDCSTSSSRRRSLSRPDVRGCGASNPPLEPIARLAT